MVAGSMAVRAGLELFRYNTYSSITSFFDFLESFDFSDRSNFVIFFSAYADLLCNYAGLLIGSIAFITQLMSTFGLYSGINLTVWHYGVFLGGMIIVNVANLLRWLAYEIA